MKNKARQRIHIDVYVFFNKILPILKKIQKIDDFRPCIKKENIVIL